MVVCSQSRETEKTLSVQFCTAQLYLALGTLKLLFVSYLEKGGDVFTFFISYIIFTLKFYMMIKQQEILFQTALSTLLKVICESDDST